MIEKEMDVFSDKINDFVIHISDKVREIHRKNQRIEDFCGNFHTYTGMHTNIIRL